MHLLLISLSHKKVSVDIRGKLSFSSMEAEKAIIGVKRMLGVREALLVSTCNRTELLVHHDCERQDLVELEDVLQQFLCCMKQVEIDSDLFDSYHDIQAVEHVFRVVVGLESLVLGETQIVGQLKSAYALSSRIGASDYMINKIMHKAFRASKRARTETQIGQGICSVSHAAAHLAGKELNKPPFRNRESLTALIIGAGEMANVTAKELAKRQGLSLTIANRSIDNAMTLAKQVDAEAIPLTKLDQAILEADVVISAASVKDPIITRERLATIDGLADTVLIDIGVPRNIAADVNQVDGIRNFSIDDLRETVDSGMQLRQSEVITVEAIVMEELAEFQKWFRSLAVGPTIKALIESCNDIRRGELDRMGSKIPEEHRQLVEQVTDRIVKKILHKPMRHLKTCHSDNVNSAEYWIEIVHSIFDLSVSEDEVTVEEEAIPGTCPHGHVMKL